MKTIISIGYEIPGYSDSSHNYNSNISLSDGDIIIFCPDFKYIYYNASMDSDHWLRCKNGV